MVRAIPCFRSSAQIWLTGRLSALTLDDPIPPTWHGCPGDKTVQLVHGTTEKIVNWAVPIATDNSEIDPTVIATSYSGDTFSVFDSPISVTYEAADAAGNTAICTSVIALNALRSIAEIDS